MDKEAKIFDISYQSLNGEDLLSLIGLVRNGLPARLFHAISTIIPVSPEMWCKYLDLTESALRKYEDDKKTFEPFLAEKIVQVFLLYKMGEEIFGQMDIVAKWMLEPNLFLAGQKPGDLLDNTFGIQLVKRELFRIREGVLA